MGAKTAVEMNAQAGGDAITLAAVTRRFVETVAIRDLSFSVGRGEMFGLIGPDGAGKTTTIRIICGLLRPDGGSVRVLGLDPVREHRRLTASVGYLSQRFSLYGDLSIDENIAFFAEIHGVRDYRGRRDRLLALDTPAALNRSLPGALYELIVGDHRRAAAILRGIGDVGDVQMFGDRVHVRLAQRDAAALERIAHRLRGAGIDIRSVRPIATSLEDVFITRPHEAAQAGYTRTNHVDTFGVLLPNNQLRVIYPDIPDNYRSRLDVQWPVYTGGRLDALERAARIEATASGDEVAAARRDVALEISRA